ncbi:AAA family ATPase [Leifsonia sp. Leaf264]|uniref:AAA family ATPase n=1 Tax=Leifsonia sp. Leaf264 TaxID=1736314 RepID=UPI0007005487|nr:SMC family ATPase [Leifsonia sp. Leaf264]KQO98199.1 hypothetical protein ASF30_09060 [Leifsonia sp. Leaf264]
MQIKSIEIEGMWSYRDPQQVVIDGHPLVVGVGENGAGKSALLVAAVVAAFYAKFPTKTVQESITTDVPQGRVSVEFEVNDTLYRVSRTFTRKGSGSAQVLVADPSTRSGWRGVTEKGVKEVDEYIVGLLGMDYQTATMTWIAEQGTYGKFAESLPSKRFELLSQIFGLDIYTPKAKAAKAAADAAAILVATVDGKLAELSGTMDAADGQQFDLDGMTDKQLSKNLSDANDDVDRYTQQAAELNATDPARQTVEARQAYELVRNDRVAKLTAATQQVERAELAIGQAKNRAAATRAAAEARFTRDLAEASTRAERIREQATTQRRAAAEQKLKIASAERDLPTFVDEVTASRETADDARRSADAAFQKAADLRGAVAQLRAESATAKAAVADAEARISLLEKSAADTDHAECFTCGQHLSASDAAALIELQRDAIASLKQKMLDLRDSGMKTNAAAEAADAERAAHLQAAKAADVEADRISTAMASLHALIGSKEQADAAEQAAAEAFQQSSKDEDAWRRQAADAHSTQIAAADADEQATVDAAETELSSARAVAAETAEPTAKETHLLEDLRAAEALVAGEASGYNERRIELERLRSEARRLVTVYSAEEHRRTEAALLRADQEDRLAALRVEKADAQREILINMTLMKAFSPAGIPAMILNTVVEQLNETVNSSLERLSNGELKVELRTSRENTNGTPDNKISVYVETPTGVRAYETLSGGQRFRVNVAIRVGLLESISRGTGTPIRSFILDEGWGTLDEKGVMSTIGTLFRLSEEMNVITVSHIDSVRDAFPARVEVVMDGGTSVAQLVA